VDGVTFGVETGEIVGLLGANGAGKTTTTQLLLGTTTKTAGRVRFFGRDFDQHRSEILKQVNYASAYARLPWRLTVRENLLIQARLYEVAGAEARMRKFLAAFEMGTYERVTFGSLSAGQKTRVILAKAFLNHPRLLLLDEPTASLDPDIASTVRAFLLEQQKEYGVAMLFTSHNMAEVSEVCDRVIVLKKGKIVAEDSPAGLARRIRQARVHLVVVDGLKRLSEVVMANKWPTQVTDREAVVTIDEEKIAYLLRELAKKGVEYSTISIAKPTLEDYFMALSRGEQV
jgi:ABC-2 type transport system ATP-binding protein